jgi:hypothetical protein
MGLRRLRVRCPSVYTSARRIRRLDRLYEKRAGISRNGSVLSTPLDTTGSGSEGEATKAGRVVHHLHHLYITEAPMSRNRGQPVAQKTA